MEIKNLYKVNSLILYFFYQIIRADLVPVYCFGENDVYKQASNPPGSWLRNFQTRFMRITTFIPPIFHGRGIFNYSFGLLPYRKPLYVISM